MGGCRFFSYEPTQLASRQRVRLRLLAEGRNRCPRGPGQELVPVVQHHGESSVEAKQELGHPPAMFCTRHANSKKSPGIVNPNFVILFMSLSESPVVGSVVFSCF